MIGALLYLRITSIRNLIVHRLGRLRQPKYLLGAVFAAAYFYYFFFRRIGAARSAVGLSMKDGQSLGTLTATFICAAFCLFAIVRVTYVLIWPPEKPGLAFSEAEIAFLFPAPITRKGLIQYRLLSAQLGILLSAALITIVFNRSGYLGGHRALHAVGWWIVLSAIDLLPNGINLTMGRLRETGSNDRLWRGAAVAAIAAYLVAVYLSVAGPLRHYFAGTGPQTGIGDMIPVLGTSPAVYWLILPFRVVFGPYLATTYREFAVAIGPALLVVAALYSWVSSSQARFEEGSIAIAAKRAAIRNANQRGEAPKPMRNVKPMPGPFPLPPHGLPEVAFLWKNLLSLRSSLFSRRALTIVMVLCCWAYFGLKPLMVSRRMSGGNDAVGFIILVFSAIMAGYTLILGPQIARQDLRNDLPNADLLKTYPLEGWRLALGELLAPTAILTAIVWVAIFAAAATFDSAGRLEWLTPAVRATVVACLCVAAPILCIIQLIVPNTVMVLMPAWYQSSRTRGGGMEMFGQRLLFGIVQLLFALLVAVPAAGAAALVYFIIYWTVGQNISLGVVVATLVVVLILAVEAVIGLWFLGDRFERFDLSTESR
jgi:ABC-2 type transport system permease protein